ncbi:MAG: DUF4956 domain-containing protein [Clostridiales bacterium]|nr:DUF4956 domain-containing protein [Clostridiales bacterium]
MPEDQGQLSFADMIKKQYLQSFGGDAVSLSSLLLGLALAFLLGLFIYYIYKRTFSGVLYSRNFNVSLVLLTLVTTLIIRCITSNLALSLGMVGALSIVRFRTAVKDPMDTVFMFWAVAAGIAIGAGSQFYILAVVGSAMIGVFLYIMHIVRGGGSYAYLLIVRHDYNCENEVAFALRKLPKGARLKSKTATQSGMEITVEMRLPGEDAGLVRRFLSIEGVLDATLVSYEGDSGAYQRQQTA